MSGLLLDSCRLETALSLLDLSELNALYVVPTSVPQERHTLKGIPSS